MQPTPEVLAAAEHIRIAFTGSPVWAPALDGTVMHSPAESVEPLRSSDVHYFIFEFLRRTHVTARFAISQKAVLLEAEGVKRAEHRLASFVDRASLEWLSGGKSLRRVWAPCNQTSRRLRPLWEVSALGVTRYVRVDGVIFERLTTNTGRG